MQELGRKGRMIELAISLHVICMGFIAGLWDREHQRGPLGRQENDGRDQALKGALRTGSSNSESKDPGPENNLVRPKPLAEVGLRQKQ